MDDFCTCGLRRIDRAFLSAGLVYCSNCDSPVCCDAVGLDPRAKPHAAEIVGEEQSACWRHWDSVADLAVSHAIARSER